MLKISVEGSIFARVVFHVGSRRNIRALCDGYDAMVHTIFSKFFQIENYIFNKLSIVRSFFTTSSKITLFRRVKIAINFLKSKLLKFQEMIYVIGRPNRLLDSLVP